MKDRERIPREDVCDLARSLLEAISGSGPEVARWKEILLGYSLDDRYSDEPYAYLICALALQAVAEGNGGIGCVLVDAEGSVVVYGHNRVIRPHFRSDLHGEMVTMDAFEDLEHDVSPGDMTLYSSLEPCPMCMVRLVTAGVGRTLYLARDPEWGMTEDRDLLPPAWRELMEGKVFGTAECSPALLEASDAIFKINIEELFELFKER